MHCAHGQSVFTRELSARHQWRNAYRSCATAWYIALEVALYKLADAIFIHYNTMQLTKALNRVEWADQQGLMKKKPL